MRRTPEIVIRPPRGFAAIDVGELWSYRGLLRSLVRRRIKSEFDQQALAYVWPVFRPVLMVILFVAFRGLSKAHTGVQIPYPLYVYAGLATWFFFIEAVQQSASSLKANAGLIQKVYFPKILAPISAILASFYTFAITVVPLAGMMVWYATPPSVNVVLLPLVLVQTGALIFGIGCIFATLGLAGADWDKILGFLLYIGLFLSPVIYDPSLLPERARFFYSMNPTVGMLMGVRGVLFQGMGFPWHSWLYSCAVTLLVAGVGVVMFQTAEKHVVDRL